ncbi:alpha/beta hydrolase [Parasphingorhabdus sp.]|jgi:pimeloyl-ACP methyl ester carboxylesterase|uniref:alpha/beta hydrolase n=1 Tax=Parasphingorhabdus sp. TaxID=2709688 RepID=UPI003D265269
MKRSYNNNTSWRSIQAFLPSKYHFTGDYAPEEDHWDWRGHTVHLDRFRNPEATHKIILLHGVGTNGRMLSTIAGGPLWKRGFETVSMDLLNYGETDVKPGFNVSYDDWVEQVDAFVTHEQENDPRPVILYGLSAGGQLAYHAAAVNKRVAGIVGMCFMDQDDRTTRRTVSRFAFADPVIIAILPWAGNYLGGLKIPMSSVTKMHTLVNDKAALKACMRDKTSAANWVSQKFLLSMVKVKPAMALEDFDVCPILLTQPEKDHWTPLSLSETVLARLKKVPTETVILEEAGHYPIEEPGLSQMNDAISRFARELKQK